MSKEPGSDLNSVKFYHGTKADLKPGDLIEPGFNSNYSNGKKASYIYLTATLAKTLRRTIQRHEKSS